MDPERVSEWSREQVLAYLETRILKRAGESYKAMALATLRAMDTDELRAMARPALALQLERQERRRRARLARKEQQNEHTD